jgi:hypothetical protein
MISLREIVKMRRISEENSAAEGGIRMVKRLYHFEIRKSI